MTLSFFFFVEIDDTHYSNFLDLSSVIDLDREQSESSRATSSPKVHAQFCHLYQERPVSPVKRFHRNTVEDFPGKLLQPTRRYCTQKVNSASGHCVVRTLPLKASSLSDLVKSLPDQRKRSR